MKRITTASILVVLVASALAAQTSPIWEPEMQINVKAVGSPEFRLTVRRLSMQSLKL